MKAMFQLTPRTPGLNPRRGETAVLVCGAGWQAKPLTLDVTRHRPSPARDSFRPWSSHMQSRSHCVATSSCCRLAGDACRTSFYASLLGLAVLWRGLSRSPNRPASILQAEMHWHSAGSCRHRGAVRGTSSYCVFAMFRHCAVCIPSACEKDLDAVR